MLPSSLACQVGSKTVHDAVCCDLDCTSILLCTAGDERSCDLATSGVCALPPVWLGESTLLNSPVERPFLAPLTTPQAPARPRCLPTRSGR
jgi:hypothetical protein